MKLDLKNNAAAQDMIRIIMREKDLSAEDAVTFAVNRDIYQKSLKRAMLRLHLTFGDMTIPREYGILFQVLLLI